MVRMSFGPSARLVVARVKIGRKEMSFMIMSNCSDDRKGIEETQK
jgi:hypothetical protein